MKQKFQMSSKLMNYVQKDWKEEYVNNFNNLLLSRFKAMYLYGNQWLADTIEHKYIDFVYLLKGFRNVPDVGGGPSDRGVWVITISDSSIVIIEESFAWISIDQTRSLHKFQLHTNVTEELCVLHHKSIQTLTFPVCLQESIIET